MLNSWLASMGMIVAISANALGALPPGRASQKLALSTPSSIQARSRVGRAIRGGGVTRPRRIRGQGSREASLRVYDGYLGARDDCASLVCHGSQNTAEIALCNEREREQRHTKNRTEHAHSSSG